MIKFLTFFEESNDDFKKEIQKLDQNKSTTYKGIPAKALKLALDESNEFLVKVWNEEILVSSLFPNALKLADVTPAFKKDDKLQAKNYRPVSVLPSVSKLFERVMQKQISSFIDPFLSPFLSGYRKGFSTQTSLMSLLEKWKMCLDNRGYSAAILMDLSKAFDTINHELLIAKLFAYGFSKTSLKLIHSYLSDRKQRIKVNNSFSEWCELLLGVPQGSVLGPLLFNIYLNDLFFLLKDIDVCNFADDTTPYFCHEELNVVLEKLEIHSDFCIKWFENNFMKLNTDKCHLLVSGHKHEKCWARVGDDQIWEENKVKLLGVTIDNQLSFENHINNICTKANRKLSVLSRMGSILDFEKKRLMFKAFIESQFKYCPLSWFFHSRKSNTKINKIHERSLRLVYNDYVSTFEQLLEKDNSFTIHDQAIQRMCIEIFKTLNGMPSDLKDIFIRKFPNSDSNLDLRIPSINTEYHGKGSFRYFGPLIWNSVPNEIRNLKSLSIFKSKMKLWKPVDCPCRNCKTYIQRLGFCNITS